MQSFFLCTTNSGGFALARNGTRTEVHVLMYLGVLDADLLELVAVRVPQSLEPLERLRKHRSQCRNTHDGGAEGWQGRCNGARL